MWQIGDCDDNNPSINPGNVEICDNIDNNCDGLQDDEDPAVLVVSGTEFFRDSDNDNYGDITSAIGDVNNLKDTASLGIVMIPTILVSVLQKWFQMESIKSGWF